MTKPVDIEAEVEKATTPPWESRLVTVPDDWYSTPPPNRRWLLTDARHHDEGVLPLAKVGLLIAEGGAGKTMASVQLAESVVTGAPWLGTFNIATTGPALLVLGEEEAEEIHRRIYRASRELDRVTARHRIVALPLAGTTCPMLDGDQDGAFLKWLRAYVEQTGPYALVIVDPVSRFCGADAERDNAAATRFCQALESLVIPSGGATILGCHHTNKHGRSAGAKVDTSSSRGSSAMTDGVRWVATMGVEYIEGAALDTVLKLAVTKTNYSKKPPPLDLRYSESGVLVPLDDNDRVATETARDASDPRAQRQRQRGEAKSAQQAKEDAAVVACVESKPGIGATELRLQVKAMAGCGSDAADTAIMRMVQAGRIRRDEDGKAKKHFVIELQPSTLPVVPMPVYTNRFNGGRPLTFEDV